MELPTGILTLVFTDIQDSSEYSERYRAAFEPLRAAHFRLLRETLPHWNGQEVSTAGDALFLVFVNAAEAVQWAVEAQRRLAAYDWPVLSAPEGAGDPPAKVEVRVRIGMHTGEPFLSLDAARPDYFGPAVNRAARVSSAAHGGQILLSSATYALVQFDLPAEIAFHDCGLHRLKGVGEDQLWQLQAPDLLQEFPPLKTLDPERHNLPVPPTPYLGREHDIRAWLEKLRQPATRLLTLTGFGGLGKTRSALYLAELSLEDYKDGVWWVEAEEARTGDEMLQRIAGALHLPPQSQMPAREQVSRFLRERNLLLVLDNTEQVADAGRFVKELLTQAPKVKFMVTSRCALEIQAERVVEVCPLPLAEAIPLFVNRIRDRQPAFELSEENRDDVAELCRRLDGVPLALELAASRIAMMSPRQMLARLNERFKLLQTRAPDLPERQRALRATIDWSYDLLTDEDKQLFAQTSVFAGGFALEDAEAVCEAFDVLEGIAELRHHSLLQSETETGAQQTRFVMLNLLREYAQERLAMTGEGGAIRLRHARYFLEYARQRLAQMRTPTEANALRELKINADNLRAAMEGAQTENDLELFAELALMRGRALWRRGFSNDAIQPIEAAIEALQTGSLPTATLLPQLLWERAGLYLDHLETTPAKTLAKQALEAFVRANDRVGAARAKALLGSIARESREYAEARAYFASALDLLHSPQEDTEIGNIYNTFGVLERRDPQGNGEEAQKHLQAAMQIRRRQGDRRGLAETLNNLGVLAYEQQNWPQAWDNYAEALKHEQEIGNMQGIARTLFNLAEVAEERAETERALRLAAGAETLMERVKSPIARVATEKFNAIAASIDASITPSLSKVEDLNALRRAASDHTLETLIPWAMMEPSLKSAARSGHEAD